MILLTDLRIVSRVLSKQLKNIARNELLYWGGIKDTVKKAFFEDPLALLRVLQCRIKFELQQILRSCDILPSNEDVNNYNSKFGLLLVDSEEAKQFKVGEAQTPRYNLITLISQAEPKPKYVGTYKTKMKIKDEKKVKNIVTDYYRIDFEKLGKFLGDLMFDGTGQCYDYPEMALLVFRLFYYQIIHPKFAKEIFHGLFANIDFSNKSPKLPRALMENELYVYLISALLSVDDKQISELITSINKLYDEKKRESVVNRLTEILEIWLTDLQEFEATNELTYPQKIKAFRNSKNTELVNSIVKKQTALVSLFAYKAFMSSFTGGISTIIEISVAALFEIDVSEMDQAFISAFNKSMETLRDNDTKNKDSLFGFAQHFAYMVEQTVKKNVSKIKADNSHSGQKRII